MIGQGSHAKQAPEAGPNQRPELGEFAGGQLSYYTLQIAFSDQSLTGKELKH